MNVQIVVISLFMHLENIHEENEKICYTFKLLNGVNERKCFQNEQNWQTCFSFFKSKYSRKLKEIWN